MMQREGTDDDLDQATGGDTLSAPSESRRRSERSERSTSEAEITRTKSSGSDLFKVQVSGKMFDTLQQYYRNTIHGNATRSATRRSGGLRFHLPREYVVPRSILRRACQSIDQRDSPDNPGEMALGEFLKALHRFHNDFGQRRGIKADVALLAELGVDLERQPFDPDCMLEWNNEFFFNSFSIQLGALERLYLTLDMGENGSLLSALVSCFIFMAVIVSVLCWIIGTVEGIRVLPCHGKIVDTCVPREPRWMEVAETICVLIFTVEILLRLLSAGQARRQLLNQRYVINVITGDELVRAPSTTLRRFTSFLLSPEAICDILSVAPFWVEIAMSQSTNNEVSEVSMLRILYIARVTRVFKLGRALNADLGQFNEVHDLFRKVLGNASPAILMTFLLIVIALFFFGTFIWFCERGEWVDRSQPRYQALVSGMQEGVRGAWLRKGDDGFSDELSPFDSIPGAFWWTVVTITTVGYGDQVPRSTAGKLVGAVAMLYGTVILGLPLFVVGATFGQEYDRLMKASARRDAHQKNRISNELSLSSHERTAQFAKATGNFIEQYKHFSKVAKESQETIGIPKKICDRWRDDLRGVLVSSNLAVAMDRLTIRVLAYLAEVEGMWSGGGEYSVRVNRVAMCRKFRWSWHMLAVTCCQLTLVPPEMLAKVLEQCLGQDRDQPAPKKRNRRQSMRHSELISQTTSSNSVLDLEAWMSSVRAETNLS